MMRRLFLQATLVCMLIALLATPAFAGLTTDPLGATGSQPPAIVTGTAPGGAPHVCDDVDNCPVSPQGNPQPAPAHITGDGAIDVFFGPYTEGDLHQGNTQVAPAQIFPGAPEIGDVNGDGYWDSDTDGYRDSDGDGYLSNPQVVPAHQSVNQPIPGPQIVCLDGGCDDDQLDGGADDDQLIGLGDGAVQP